jgi:hypothetical protein
MADGQDRGQRIDRDAGKKLLDEGFTQRDTLFSPSPNGAISLSDMIWARMSADEKREKEPRVTLQNLYLRFKSGRRLQYLNSLPTN